MIITHRQKDKIGEICLLLQLIESNIEMVSYQCSFFIDFDEILFIDGVSERYLNIEAARI